MFFRRAVMLVAVSACVASSVAQPARAQFSELAKNVPETANMIVLVNATDAFDSKISKSQGWQQDREKQFAAGLSFIPPLADKVLIANQLDLEFMHPIWEVAVAQFDNPPTPSALAERFGGTIDKLANRPAVRLPDDSFVVQLADNVMGAMAPGSRQQVSRWLTRSNGQLSSYLMEGIQFEDAGAEVIIALDFSDALSTADVKERIENLESLKDSKIDQQKLVQVLASLRGVMLGITLGDTVYGSVKVDFDEDATLLSEIAKPMFLEVLGNRGLMIDEMRDWTPTVAGKQFRLSGPLTFSGLTHISSLISLPTQALNTPAASGRSEVDPSEYQSTPLQATQTYFTSVQHLIRNLEDKDPRTMGQKAQWYESYARKIDRLPILNVDDEMLQYGSYVSSQLHGGSMGIKGITINQAVAENQAANNTAPFGGAVGDYVGDSMAYNAYNGYRVGGFRYGRFGGYGRGVGVSRVAAGSAAVRSELRQQQTARTAVRVQARANYGKVYQQTMAQIEAATTKVRHDMTQKYKVEF